MKKYGIIMAGGGGTRFWPLSRQNTPKQLLNLSGNDLMINETIDRLKGVIDAENIFIVTNHVQADKMKESVNGRIPHKNILIEPAARNTAACIGYAAEEILQKYGDGIMCIFPSDHYIKNLEAFQQVLNTAISVAEIDNKLVTIGINPNYPATGYGYINYNSTVNQKVYDVIRFVEKPDYQTAKSYVETPGYVWNSGMFIWRASTISEKFNRFLPKTYQLLKEIAKSMGTSKEYDVINEIYPSIPSISIDYGIMERADDVVVVPGDFGWNDVGSWDNLGVLYEADANGNIIKGEQVNIATKNSICYSQSRLIATIGIEDLIVVETSDAILVCKKDMAQNVKEVVDHLKEKGLDKYIQ